jgi:hypothetical protein
MINPNQILIPNIAILIQSNMQQLFTLISSSTVTEIYSTTSYGWVKLLHRIPTVQNIAKNVIESNLCLHLGQLDRHETLSIIEEV